MHVKFSPNAAKELKLIKRNDKKLAQKIERQILLFISNPKHPSLRIHKLTGRKHDIFSLSVTMGIRMLYKIIDKNIIYFTNIGTHDQVYKK